MRVFGKLPSAFLAAAAVSATMAPAYASYYYSSSNPLTAWENGVSQAEMYGRFYKEELTYLRNNTTQRDPRPGGDAVYEETFYDSYKVRVSGGSPNWAQEAVDTGPKTTSSTWYSQYDHHPLFSSADKSRMRTNICEDHGIFSKDPCSAQPMEEFN